MKNELNEMLKQELPEQPAWVQLELPFESEDFPLGQACSAEHDVCESCQ